MNCQRTLTSRTLLQNTPTGQYPVLTFLYLTPTILQTPRRYISHDGDDHSYKSKAREESSRQPNVRTPWMKKQNRPYEARVEDLSNPFIDPIRRPLQPRPIARRSNSETIYQVHSQRAAAANTNADPAADTSAFSKILNDRAKWTDQPNSSYSRRTITMTKAEQDIFERLQFLHNKKAPTPVINNLSVDEFDHPNSEGASLEQLFNSISIALQKTEKYEDNKLAKQLASHDAKQHVLKAARRSKQQQSLQSVSWPQLSPAEPFQNRLSAVGADNAISTICRPDETKQITQIQHLARVVQTDAELWEMIDKHVFSMMRELKALLETREAGDNSTVEKSTKRKKKSNSTSTSVGHLATLVHTKSELEMTLIRKVTNIYGPALLYAARLFRSSFPASQYPELILPTIKALGPISYVLSASTSLYNELLYMRWECFRDLDGCASLIEEMISRNILADRHTALVYQAAKDTRDFELGMVKDHPSSLVSRQSDDLENAISEYNLAPDIHWNRKGSESIPFGTKVKSFKQGYWRLQGVESAWLRWSKSHGRLITLTRQENQRRREEKDRIAASAAASKANTNASSESEKQEYLQDEESEEPEVEIISNDDSKGTVMAGLGS